MTNFAVFFINVVGQTGNELVVGRSGIYQIIISLNADTTTESDTNQPYLLAVITVDGIPVFVYKNANHMSIFMKKESGKT